MPPRLREHLRGHHSGNDAVAADTAASTSATTAGSSSSTAAASSVEGGGASVVTVAPTPPLPEEQWVEQPVTHFDATDARRWKQRYFSNDHYWTSASPEGAPARPPLVFLCVGGEAGSHFVTETSHTLVHFSAQAEPFGTESENPIPLRCLRVR